MRKLARGIWWTAVFGVLTCVTFAIPVIAKTAFVGSGNGTVALIMLVLLGCFAFISAVLAIGLLLAVVVGAFRSFRPALLLLGAVVASTVLAALGGIVLALSRTLNLQGQMASAVNSALAGLLGLALLAGSLLVVIVLWKLAHRQRGRSEAKAATVAVTLAVALIVGLQLSSGQAARILIGDVYTNLGTAADHLGKVSGNSGALTGNASAGTSGIADNCQAGYGYLDTESNQCYQGAGPGANNSAGDGTVPKCPAGYPYYNAGTVKCYSGVPGSGIAGNGSTGAGGSGPGGAGGPTHCGLSVDRSYDEGEAGIIYEEQPTAGCYLHVVESESGSYSYEPCSSNVGSPPSTISNIVDWQHTYVNNDVVKDERWSLRLANGATISISGCYFNSYGMTELNHLTDYNTIGGG